MKRSKTIAVMVSGENGEESFGLAIEIMVSSVFLDWMIYFCLSVKKQ